MKMYAKYVKAKDKALSVFTEARATLKRVHSDLLDEHKKCGDEIKERVDQQRYLETEVAAVHNHIQAINAVVGDQDHEHHGKGGI